MIKERYTCLPFFGVVLVVMFTASCSDQRTDENWYEQSQGRTMDRDAYIEAQKRMGVDGAEAGRQYDLDESIMNTWGREGSALYGKENE